MRPQASINLEHGVMIQAVEFEPGATLPGGQAIVEQGTAIHGEDRDCKVLGSSPGEGGAGPQKSLQL